MGKCGIKGRRRSLLEEPVGYSHPHGSHTPPRLRPRLYHALFTYAWRAPPPVAFKKLLKNTSISSDETIFLLLNTEPIETMRVRDVYLAFVKRNYCTPKIRRMILPVYSSRAFWWSRVGDIHSEGHACTLIARSPTDSAV